MFLTSDAASAVIAEVFGIAGFLADLVVFLATQTIDMATFCGTDPPSMPTFSALDVAQILAGTSFSTNSAQTKLAEATEIALWYAMCQCDVGSPSAPPAAPVYPTGSPQISPPGSNGVPNANNQPCLVDSDTAVWLTFTSAITQQDSSTHRPPAGSNVTSLTLQGGSHTASGAGWTLKYTLNAIDGASNVIGTPAIATFAPGQNGSLTIDLPAGWADFIVHVQALSGSGAAQTWNPVAAAPGFYWQYWCNGVGPLGTSTPCCPPDPQVRGLLTQILNDLEFIFSNLPVRVPNYAAGTAHSGLSGQGTVSLASTTIATKIDITSFPSVYGTIAGNPTTYIDVGWVSPVNNEGPESGLRLSRASQVIPLPEATSALDYSLPPGEQVTITELQAG